MTASMAASNSEIGAVFESAALPLRPGLPEACEGQWQRLGRAGTWWDDGQRLALASQARSAACPTCAAARAGEGDIKADRHGAVDSLPAAAVEAVHMVSNTPELLSNSWYESLVGQLQPAEYVEIVGLVATVKFVDTLARGAGAPRPALPPRKGGVPTRELPEGVNYDAAWVPTVAPEKATGSTAVAYEKVKGAWGFVTNMRRALTLVPAEQDAMTVLAGFYYRKDLELSKAQIEFAASRVSHLNGCSYCNKLHTRLLRRATGQDEETTETLVAGIGVTEAPIEAAPEVDEFTASVMRGNTDEIGQARAALAAAVGPTAAADVAGIVACFDSVNRITAGTGTMFDEEFNSL
jgi:AhpD family alkylhydroperoxidase